MCYVANTLHEIHGQEYPKLATNLQSRPIAPHPLTPCTGCTITLPYGLIKLLLLGNYIKGNCGAGIRVWGEHTQTTL